MGSKEEFKKPQDLKAQVVIKKSGQIIWRNVAQAFCFPPWVAFFALLFRLFELAWHELVLRKTTVHWLGALAGCTAGSHHLHIRRGLCSHYISQNYLAYINDLERLLETSVLFISGFLMVTPPKPVLLSSQAIAEPLWETI